MMLKLKAFLLTAAFGVLFASNAVAAGKIALVDTATAIYGSGTAQAMLKEAEQSADFLSLKAKYESSTADLQAMAKEADTKRLTWSKEEAAEHQKKMGYAKADAELAVQKIKAEQQQLQQSILQQLGPLAQQAIQEIVQEQEISVLLRAETVLIADQGLYITANVAERIDQKASEKK